MEKVHPWFVLLLIFVAFGIAGHFDYQEAIRSAQATGEIRLACLRDEAEFERMRRLLVAYRSDSFASNTQQVYRCVVIE